MGHQSTYRRSQYVGKEIHLCGIFYWFSRFYYIVLYHIRVKYWPNRGTLLQTAGVTRDDPSSCYVQPHTDLIRTSQCNIYKEKSSGYTRGSSTCCPGMKQSPTVLAIKRIMRVKNSNIVIQIVWAVL